MTSRPPPPRFEGCTLEGVRFEAENTATRDVPFRRVCSVVAVDDATGSRQWQVQLWSEPSELDFGLLAPPRYLHRITPDLVPRRLRAIDEFGFVYVVDLATHSARAIGRPEPARAPGALEPAKPSASRIGRPSPAAIVFEGRRYQQILNGEREGLDQRTGLMSVTDEASHERIDVARIYDYPRREGLEDDVGDVFFVSAALDADSRQIVIESERHERFAYRIDDGSVHRLA